MCPSCPRSRNPRNGRSSSNQASDHSSFTLTPSQEDGYGNPPAATGPGRDGFANTVDGADPSYNPQTLLMHVTAEGRINFPENRFAGPDGRSVVFRNGRATHIYDRPLSSESIVVGDDEDSNTRPTTPDRGLVGLLNDIEVASTRASPVGDNADTYRFGNQYDPEPSRRAEARARGEAPDRALVRAHGPSLQRYSAAGNAPRLVRAWIDDQREYSYAAGDIGQEAWERRTVHTDDNDPFRGELWVTGRRSAPAILNHDGSWTFGEVEPYRLWHERVRPRQPLRRRYWD